MPEPTPLANLLLDFVEHALQMPSPYRLYRHLEYAVETEHIYIGVMSTLIRDYGTPFVLVAIRCVEFPVWWITMTQDRAMYRSKMPQEYPGQRRRKTFSEYGNVIFEGYARQDTVHGGLDLVEKVYAEYAVDDMDTTKATDLQHTPFLQAACKLYREARTEIPYHYRSPMTLPSPSLLLFNAIEEVFGLPLTPPPIPGWEEVLKKARSDNFEEARKELLHFSNVMPPLLQEVSNRMIGYLQEVDRLLSYRASPEI